jgi:hypothetical protein
MQCIDAMKNCSELNAWKGSDFLHLSRKEVYFLLFCETLFFGEDYKKSGRELIAVTATPQS